MGDGQKTYTFVEKEKQQAALKFLLDEVLTYPKWLFDTEVGEYTYLLRNTPLGVVENAPTQILKNAQSYILWDLLSNNRLVRMLENEAVNGKKAFTAVELMDGLHRSIFATTERGALPDDTHLAEKLPGCLDYGRCRKRRGKNQQEAYGQSFPAG